MFVFYNQLFKYDEIHWRKNFLWISCIKLAHIPHRMKDILRILMNFKHKAIYNILLLKSNFWIPTAKENTQTPEWCLFWLSQIFLVDSTTHSTPKLTAQWCNNIEQIFFTWIKITYRPFVCFCFIIEAWKFKFPAQPIVRVWGVRLLSQTEPEDVCSWHNTWEKTVKFTYIRIALNYTPNLLKTKQRHSSGQDVIPDKAALFIMCKKKFYWFRC